jgi:3-methyladenine DNA glycosylase AlkD
MELSNPTDIASQLDADIQALPDANTAAIRAVRWQYSRHLKQADPAFVLQVANTLIEKYDHRWLAYELIRYHQPTYRQLGQAELAELGRGIDSWDTVDAFARILAGPVWLKGQVSDDLIRDWVKSEDLWWRRAALVCTVALNVRSQGGRGDVARTLEVCRLLVTDREDMVVKAMSWALRELVVHDPEAVAEFLREYDADLPARVKREVSNKLTTGLKNPKQKTG